MGVGLSTLMPLVLEPLIVLMGGLMQESPMRDMMGKKIGGLREVEQENMNSLVVGGPLTLSLLTQRAVC